MHVLEKSAKAVQGRKKQKRGWKARKSRKGKTGKDSHLEEKERVFTDNDNIFLISYWEEKYSQYFSKCSLAFAEHSAQYLNSKFEDSMNKQVTTKKKVKKKIEYMSKTFRKSGINSRNQATEYLMLQ